MERIHWILSADQESLKSVDDEVQEINLFMAFLRYTAVKSKAKYNSRPQALLINATDFYENCALKFI